jgi:nucleotide-binding universal stress UspA family protein
MIQKILCPTDLTPESTNGVRCAFSLARRNGAELIIFHAISFPRVRPCPVELDVFYDWQQNLARFTVERLLVEGDRSVKRFICKNLVLETIDVAWRARVALLGRLADEIVTAAIQEEADLIVVDPRPRSWLARLWPRGIVETVSREAPCAVLSIDARKSRISSDGWPLPVFKQLPSY